MFHENGVAKSLSVEELALKQLANKAAKGDLRALKLLFELKDRYQGPSGESPFIIQLRPEDRNL